MLQSKWFQWLSLGLIVAGVALIGLSYYQQFSSEIWYWWKSQQGTYYTVDPTLPDTNNKVVTIQPASTDFGLVIEKLNINEPVVADIDPFNSAQYLAALQQTPIAQAKGTVAPGQPGLTYLFGHSTINAWEIGQHKAPFTLLNKLEVGDRIVVYHQQQRYDYFVTGMDSISPYQIEVMQQKPDKPTLILQTCDPPGENSRRLLIKAEMADQPTDQPQELSQPTQ